MVEVQHLFDPDLVNARQFEPVQSALKGAQRFTRGAYNPRGLEQVQADRGRAFRIQQAYHAAERAPQSPTITRSYGSLRRAVNQQYEYMTRPTEQGGLGIHHEVVAHDPYHRDSDKQGAQAMADDVRQGHIKTFATASTGGHAFFSDEENDKFRAVHDFFGHAATGRGFDRHGEEAAFLSHKQMFPKRALPALVSETRGQNSYLNYGPEHDFPNQSDKLIGLPRFATVARRRRAL